MYTYEFNTVQDMKESQYNFKKGDTIYVSKYYPSIELIDSELIYDVMSYDDWLLTLPQDMRVASYTSGWWNYDFIQLAVDEYGNHTLNNGMIAKLRFGDTVYAEQYGAKGDGISNDITAIRHLFGMNKRHITIKFQSGKQYNIGTEIYNAAYYNEDLLAKAKSAGGAKLTQGDCVCNEYQTQGGKCIGYWCMHIKPCLSNIIDVVVDGNNATIFIPDNQFSTVSRTSTPFSWLEMTGYINGLEIKNFIIDGNGLNQVNKNDGSNMVTTNHGLFYGCGATISEQMTTQESLATLWSKQFAAAGVSPTCFDDFPRQLCNLYIHDNVFKRCGSGVDTGDQGGDGILIIPPPVVDNVVIENNHFEDVGRWVVAVDLVNDKKPITNFKIKNNIITITNNNYVVDSSNNQRFRGLGFIDFECTRQWINLEISDNTINSLGGIAINGGPDAYGKNIRICDNYIDVPSHYYRSAYPYDLYFYNLNAQDLYIEGNTIINRLTNDNLRSIGYAIKNITIRNNRVYKSLVMNARTTGCIIIDGNVMINDNNIERTSDCQVIDIGGTSDANRDTVSAQIVMVNNKGGLGGPFLGFLRFPPNYSIQIKDNILSHFNVSFEECYKPSIDFSNFNLQGSKKSLRFAQIFKPFILSKLAEYRSMGLYVNKGDVIAISDARMFSAATEGYCPITTGSFREASADVYLNNCNDSITDYADHLFYNDNAVYRILNSGTLGPRDAITHTKGIAVSGDINLKYLAPVATVQNTLIEQYGDVNLDDGKIAYFKASEYESGTHTFYDINNHYSMFFKDASVSNITDSSKLATNIIDGEFVTTKSTYFDAFNGIEVNAEDYITVVLIGSKINLVGIEISDTIQDRPDKALIELNFNCDGIRCYNAYNYYFDTSYITDKKMYVMSFCKNKEDIIYINNIRIDLDYKKFILPEDLDIASHFKLCIGRTAHKDWGAIKFGETKIKEISLYNRRLNKEEIDALYNSIE